MHMVVFFVFFRLVRDLQCFCGYKVSQAPATTLRSWCGKRSTWDFTLTVHTKGSKCVPTPWESDIRSWRGCKTTHNSITVLNICWNIHRQCKRTSVLTWRWNKTPVPCSHQNKWQGYGCSLQYITLHYITLHYITLHLSQALDPAPHRFPSFVA